MSEPDYERHGLGIPLAIALIMLSVPFLSIASSWYGDAPELEEVTIEKMLTGSGVEVLDVSSGGGHTCAILSNQSVYCWGSAGYGQLGNGIDNFDGSGYPDDYVEIPPSRAELPEGQVPTKISSGAKHNCVLTESEDVFCWGDNEYGQLGISGVGNSGVNVPTMVPIGSHVSGNSSVTYIDAGESNTCAITAAGVALQRRRGGRGGGLVGAGSAVGVPHCVSATSTLYKPGPAPWE